MLDWIGTVIFSRAQNSVTFTRQLFAEVAVVMIIHTIHQLRFLSLGDSPYFTAQSYGLSALAQLLAQ